MIDITSLTDGDLVLRESQAAKAANVLQIQTGSLEYAKEFGIDLAFFLDPDFNFQNESFKAYLIQRLSEHHVNVNQVLDELERFQQQLTFLVGETEDKTGGFIA